MPSLPRRAHLRRALRATVVATPAVWALALPATSRAVPPTTWEDSPPMSSLTALVIFGGIPLALFALIALATLAPSVVRGGERPGVGERWSSAEWFNGPASDDEHADQGAAALPAGTPPAQEAPAPAGLSDRFSDGTTAASTRQGVAVRATPPPSGTSIHRGSHPAGHRGSHPAGHRGSHPAGATPVAAGVTSAGGQPSAEPDPAVGDPPSADSGLVSVWGMRSGPRPPAEQPQPARAPALGGSTPANAPRGTAVAVKAKDTAGGASARW